MCFLLGGYAFISGFLDVLFLGIFYMFLFQVFMMCFFLEFFYVFLFQVFVMCFFLGFFHVFLFRILWGASPRGFALCFYSGFGYCFFLLGLCAISLYRFLYHAFHLHLYRFLHRTFHLHFMLCLYVNLLNSALFLHSVLYLYTRFSYYTFLSRLYSILTYQIFTPFFPPILPTAALS